MTQLELLELERLLLKLHTETESPLGLSKIRPCLFMVRDKLKLIKTGFISDAIVQQTDYETRNN